MAKKKNNKNNKTAAPIEIVERQEMPVVKETTTMKEKVEVKQPDRRQERISRLVGSIFIGIGILLVAFGIYSFIRYREEPVLDSNLEAPALEEVTSLTNGETIAVRGSAEGYDTVFVYVNDEKVEEVNVDDGKFSFEYTASTQGDHSVSVAGVKGFPSRSISPRSETRIATVDWTAPSEESVQLTYGTETNKNTFTMVGTAEANSTVIVKRGTESYEALADASGRFRISDVALDEGRNVFTVVVRDLAGNEIELDEKVRVTYTPGGSVNGDAVIDDKLPQAAGEFDNLFANQLMLTFGLIALAVFAGSTGVMYYKKKQ